jgi:DNA-binding NarL/FixJ family response regulator
MKKTSRPAGAAAMLMSKRYRILVADDHSVVRRGVRTLLESQPGIEVCGEASTGTETMDRVKKEKPDLVVLDLTMPEMNGLQVAATIRQESPSTEVLILTMHFSEELARDVLRSGALGYVLKSDADEELLAAVDHARHRQPFFTSKLAVAMAQSYMHNSDTAGKDALPGFPLTPREIEVIQYLAKGKGNKEVAAALRVSTRTVESHRNHIMHKMNFGSFSELVRFAVRNNLVDP